MAGKKGMTWHKPVELRDRLTAVSDDQLLVGGTITPLPADHWCDGCGNATRMTDRIMCPFVEGSCVRVPGTLENPDPELLHKRIVYDRLYTDAHKEVFEAVEAEMCLGV